MHKQASNIKNSTIHWNIHHNLPINIKSNAISDFAEILSNPSNSKWRVINTISKKLTTAKLHVNL